MAVVSELRLPVFQLANPQTSGKLLAPLGREGEAAEARRTQSRDWGRRLASCAADPICTSAPSARKTFCPLRPLRICGAFSPSRARESRWLFDLGSRRGRRGRRG